MTKLKTLKDIEFVLCEKQTGKIKGVIAEIDELKAEVVKCIKEDRLEFKNHLHAYGIGNLIKEWMKRLNITEEDLK